MIVGVPKEIKPQENRVGLIPPSVRELTGRGHGVVVESGAGAGIGLSDEDYRAAGATVVDTADEVFATAEMIVKVKEPQPVECARLREDQVLFTFLHLAPDPVQARGLIDSGCVAIAYETVTDDHGGLPLLAPMSEVAGRMSVQVGAHHLQKPEGGMGLLLGPVAGVEPAEVVILGGGVSGSAAADVAIGMGARVTVLEKSLERLTALRARFGNRLNGVYSTAESVERYVLAADLVIGAVLLPGAVAPKLVGRELLGAKRPGSVMVDIAIDQGGCFETSRATTHAAPVYTVDGVVHYCVANMPGAVPRTSAYALNFAVLPHVLALADKGWRRALADNRHLRAGLNVRHGRVTHEAVAAGLGCEFTRTLEEVAA
ncbi:MAG: alanine dehydrogenase [Alphaproteobacteria bacterium]|jgi:alanine dehydrogenase|nr:alanine dehydrogenase [Alphaproteobacteria bacterium]